MGTANLTNFPVTFHDYSFMADNGNTRAEASYYINSAIEKAHALIMDKSMSPYEAWTRATYRDVAKLPELLNLSKKESDMYRRNPGLSPPVENIIHFCKKLGVHPAYLQPSLKHAKYAYHYPVVEAMAQMYMDPATLPRDREICMKAFTAERKRFNRLLDHDDTRVAAAFSKISLGHVKLLNKDNSYANSMRNDFECVADTARGDVSLAFSMHEDYLEKRLVAAYAQVMALESALAQKQDIMLELTKLLYGKNNPQGNLDLIAEQMRAGRSSPKDMLRDWKFSNHNMLRRMVQHEQPEPAKGGHKKKFAKVSEYISTPASLHPDFELTMRQQGLSETRIKGMFLRGMPAYIDARAEYAEKFPKAESALMCAEHALAAFQQWRDNSSADKSVMPLFRNYALIDACLGPDGGAEADADYARAAKIRKTLHLPTQPEKIASMDIK